MGNSAPAAQTQIAPDDWSPSIGRMDANLTLRHLPSDLLPQLLWSERFTNATLNTLPDWRTLGQPTLKLLRLAGANGVEFGSSNGSAGFERAIDPKMLAGKDVRIELRFACPSARRVAALRGVTLSVVASGREQVNTIALPLVADVSSGWETQSWCVHFQPDIRAASVRIVAAGTDALLTCSRLAIYDETWASALAGHAPASQPADNLIVDGDFETGQPRFSVSAARRWPDGSELVLPVNWRFTDDKAAGRQALEVEATAAATRLLFGPLDLSSVRRPSTQPEGQQPYRLSLYARAARPAAITATLRSTIGVIGQATFQPQEAWGWYSAELRPLANTAGAAGTRWAELVLDIVTADRDLEANAIGFDAVRLALSQQPTTSAPVRPQPFDLGILVGDGAENIDLRSLFDVKDGLIFTVRIVGEPRTPPPGQLAIDLVDAADHVVWTRTATPKLDANGRYEEPVRLPMPRGYYRALATLWSGQPGRSEFRGHSSASMAVVSLDDPVPIGGPFGLSARGGTISLRSTQLGAAWARADLSAGQVKKGAGWDLTLWQWLLGRAAQADVDVVAALTLPQSQPAAARFVTECLGHRDALPTAVVLDSPSSSRSAGLDAAAQLKLARDAIRSRGLDVKVIRDISAGSLGEPVTAADADVLGIAVPPAALPELSEAALERLGQGVGHGAARRPIWDLDVPAALGESPDWATPAGGNAASLPVTLVRTAVDPLRSASRMVRAALIRGLTGVQRIDLDVAPLAPLRTTLQADERRLHEPDYSPRVAVTAFEAMAGLLNDATLKRWIDLPGGARVLYYEKDDGWAVAAMWRPFGLSPTRVSFESLPEDVELLNVTGASEPAEMIGGRRLVEINEVVRYLVAPSDLRETLRTSLDTMRTSPGGE
jgi:hypothetical protein